MHSHMYFYAESTRPDWKTESPDDAASRARERMIADALLAVVPALHEPSGQVGAGPGLWLALSPLDQLFVHADHVHWDIKYRGPREMEEFDTMSTLRVVAALLERVAGFDFFESGCQGLDMRGDIEQMPAVLRGEFEAVRWTRR